MTTSSNLFITHLSIIYVLFVPGLLIVLFSRRWIGEANLLIEGYDLLIVTSLLFSVAINGVIGLILTGMDFGFDSYIYFISVLNLLLLTGLYMFGKGGGANLLINDFREKKYLYAFVATFFVIMFYNGGLIEILADSWWHMSLANKIAVGNSFSLDRHHLTGEPGFGVPYVPLWHVQLAFIKLVSGQELPYIWHALAPWIVSATLFSFYRFSNSVVKNKWAALISVIFFTLLLGGINSYLRVSPWPGNVSYVFLYLLIFLAFKFIDLQSDQSNISSIFGLYKNLGSQLIRKKYLVCLIVLSILIILGVHAAQLIWFVIVFTGYFIFLYQAKNITHVLRSVLEKDCRTLLPIIGLLMVLIILRLISGGKLSFSNPTIELIQVVPIIIMFVTLIIIFKQINQTNQNSYISRIALSLISALSIYFIIDWPHLRALFIPALDFHDQLPHVPRVFEDSFGIVLRLPSWTHQIRWGLLYSGVLAIPVSIYLAMVRRDRGSYFLASTAIIGFLGVVSPYYFTALLQLIPYNSMYRVHIIIFIPIIYALFFTHVWSKLRIDNTD